MTTSNRVFARTLFTTVLVAYTLAPAAGCITGEDLDEDIGPADDDGPTTGISEVRVPGAWWPANDVIAAGMQQYVKYEGPPPWQGGANCGGSLLSGTRQLGDYLKANFPGRVTAYGGYSCRPNTANTSETSVHGTGRALDLFIPMDGGDADNTRGDEVAAFLIRNAQAIGVQYLIWDHTQWSADHGGNKLAHYGGPNPHIDHIHVEINHAGGNRQTPWFTGGGDCSVHGDHRLWCRNTASAPMHADPSYASPVVNVLRTSYSYFECWGTGELHQGGNTTWYRTIGDDNGNRGWLPAWDLATSGGFDADPSALGLPHC